MALETSVWNVVIIGGWNRGILTPSGIAKRLFNLDEGTPINIEVSLESVGTLRVAHENVKVIALSNQLEVIASDSTPDCLERAMQASANALQSLPSTPVAAGGINIRFIDSEPPSTLAEMIEAKCDIDAGKHGLEFEVVRYARTLTLEQGVLNIDLALTPGAGMEILLNFHLASNSTKELEDWLRQPVASLYSLSETIMKDIFKMEIPKHE